MQENIRKQALSLSEQLKKTAQQLEDYNKLNLTDDRTWFLLVAPLIGDTRQQLEQFESDFTTGAFTEDTPIEMLAEHLKRSLPTMYRRARQVRSQQESKQ